jgi:DNA-binding NtrC family response regulator
VVLAHSAEILSKAGEIVRTPIVLVVDDEVLIRWSLSEGLSDQGYPVRLAGTATEARTVLDEVADSPLVVILDLRLPDMADLSLVREVRRRRPDAPVILMTAYGTAEDAREATSLGVWSLVDKPFDVSKIVELVGEAWSAREATP